MKDRTTLARWTPRRLLSLLMALIMTLSLLPTAALAAAGDYTLTVTNPLNTQLLVGQESADITATLTDNTTTGSIPKKVRLRVTVTTSTGTGNCTIQYYEASSGAYVSAAGGYLDDGTNYLSVSPGGSVSAKFKLKCDNPARYNYTVEAFEEGSTAGTWSSINSSYSTGFWGKDAIENLTVDPAEPEAGLPFTVTAMTNVDNGKILFKYGSQFETVEVLPMGDGTGYARHTFTAETGETVVTANLFDAVGIPPADKSATFTLATPATYHTVMFRANGDNVYSLPAPQPVKHNETATAPTFTPERKGYTFGGWYKDAACTDAAAYIFATPVTGNLELYAKWTATPVTVILPTATDLPTGVTIFPTAGSSITSSVGGVVHFNVTVPDKYNTADLQVSAGHFGSTYRMLVPVARYETADSVTLYYQFTVTEDLVDPATSELNVTVSNFIEKTFTVMMPTGHFNAEITGATPAPPATGTVSTVAAGGKSASIVYGGGYTFTVKPHEGYDVAVYVNGVKKDALTGNSYTVGPVTGPQRVEVVESAIPNYNVTFTVPLSGQTFTQSVTRGGNASKPGVDPEREGYDFAGWYTAADYTSGTEFNFATSITSDTILFGKLTPKIYTITYYGNGNDGGTVPAAQSKTHGLAVQLSTDVPTRVGHKFLGWGTTADATAPSYQPGDMYSVDGKIELYAVWQKNTYTITFSSGEGYTLHSGHGSMTVADGENFDFNLIVDPAYAQNAPEVWTNTTGVGTGSKLTNPVAYTNPVDGSKQYHYTLTNVKADTAVNVKVTANATYTVTFMTGTDVYQTQQVEFNHKATQPVDPKVEGFTFGGWYKDPGCADADKWNFATDTVTGPTTLYAKLTAIEPVITWPTTTTGYTIEVKGTEAGTATETTLANGDKVAYGSTVTFTIKILDGYDASKMQVGLNGVYLAAKDITDNVYTYEFTAKENTKITVVGVARKTVTIIYNANARDDVSGMPEAQTVKYYLDTTPPDNDTIIKQFPARTGYDFLGWSRSSEADAADTGYEVATIKSATGATAKFTENTTLYAVWKAVDTTVSLKVTDVAATDTTTPTAPRYLQYEGEKITLQATLNFFAKGTVVFYKGDATGATGATGEQLGSTSINGKTAELTVTVGQYKSADKNEYYWVEFEPEADEGYVGSKSAVANVGILSKAIRWSTNTDASKLLIYEGSTATTTPITGSMIAGQTYTLKVRTGEIIGVEVPTGTQPVLGQDYKIVWQYYEVDKNDWTTATESSDKDTYLVTGKYSGYQFRAQIVPLGKDHDSLYLKAAKYNGDTFEADQYNTCLYTTPTDATALQGTATELAITGADDEAADVTINGNTPFNTTGEHKAQFEGKKVTLTATVKDTTTGTPAVTTGEVNFYRKGATADTLLNASPIAVGTNGVATCEVEISKWTDGKSVTENKDEFYAVYLANATYDTSASWTATAAGSTATGKLEPVYIKSTAIKTPIIESKLANEANENATTYTADLTGLLAGVQHEFKLRTGNAEPDWSVVALDGRTVEAKNYDIEWQYKTTGNFAKADNDSTAAIYTTKTTKFGDQYRVVLNPKGDMTVGAMSKVAEIGKKQGVTVKVEASADWVYQLNDITLTATVAAAGTSPTMKPTGTVTFYYSVDNGTTWTKIGDTKDLAETAGSMTASITTKELPVTAGTNTKQNVEITAVYEGNETFAVSGNYNETTNTVSAGTTANGVDDDTVTVYSSVVYVKDTVENKTVSVSNKTHESGIYIYAEDDKVLANEGNVNLKLSEVYTLDHATDAADKALLAYGTDYTVQWQMLSNAAAYPDKAADGTPWTNITSATGTTCQIDVEHGAAYRAVITVNDTPIAKGSYEKIDQGTVGTADKNDGRQVYYSNILVAANAPATLTVNVNTDNTSKGYEGIVEGETVTIHTFTSGATGTTPISQLTVNIYPGKPAEVAAATTPVAPVFTAEKANVNGHVSFDWNKDVTPGYYTLKVKATFTNGYDDKEITRTLIVRDNDYKFELSGDNAVYNGKVQGLKVTVADMGIENALAQKSVVVYYYTDEARTQQVEPTQAGTYYATVRLQESAYWTEKTFPATFTIKPREVSVVDLVAQAKVYDGTTNANIQEIILNDAAVDPATGLPTDGKGIIDGDSVYAVGTGYTSLATAGTADLGVKNVSLMGDDAANYDLTSYSHTEKFNIQRSQVKGAIVSGRTYKYTGKDIKLAASDIYLIDQAGSQLTDYDVTYYYHNGDGVEKVDAMNKMGKYTVIARPEQTNYKGGATETVYVGTTDNAGTLVTNAVSSLITISNTVELYGAAGNKGIVATATNNATVTVQYQNGTGWSDARPTDAGRYLVKVTTSTGDTAYGLYTVVKARPEFTPTTDKPSMEYTSGRYDGAIGAGFVNGKSNDTAETYITYTGGTIQGVAYEAPTEVGKYIATVHVGETANYTAHEKQVAFEITPKALTITADDISRQQYGAYPDLTASFKGLATGGVAADTSLRDVQIQPELIDKSNYTNDASDQVGNNYKIIAVAALARNYTVSYVDGNMSVTREDPKPYLEIRGMIENGDGATDLAYYGDVIQLYAYGNQIKTTTGDVYNTSSILAWSVDKPALADITQDGLLTVKGVGTVIVTLKRGIGAQQISTSLTFVANPKEVSIDVPDVDKVYTASEQTYNGAVTVNGLINGDTDAATLVSGDKRTVVGSQITSYKVDTTKYVSETYGGLFTINVKDVDIKPTAANTIYGTRATGLTYTEETPAGSDTVLTNGMAVSVADAYNNLDVLNGYEILVAGRENENYNVKYVTDQDAPDVEVTPKALTIKTGTLKDQTGMTSGSQNPMGKYPVNGFAVDSAIAMGMSNVRMYGEPNWVMDETLDTLISGDTLADLTALGGKLVSFNYNIGADANITYLTRNDAAPAAVDGRAKYDVVTNDSMMDFKNYDETYTLGTQNIYQRPVELKLRDGMTELNAYKPTIMPGGTVDETVLKELIINNLIVTKHNNEGGLAELLKHTIKDLDIQITHTISGDTITVTVTIGNQNYYLANSPVKVTVKVDPTKIVAKYGPLGWTSSSVTMVPVDEGGNEGSPDYVSGRVWYEIYVKDPSITNPKYSDYKGKTTVRKVEMIKGSSPGVYIANYDRLPAGEYVTFAIAEGYTIIE